MAKRRILVLGEDSLSFLSVIRSLGRAGIEVHVAWCPMDSAALASRYIHAIHRMPPFIAGSDEWIISFQELFQRENFDLVLPTTDSSVLPFQLQRKIFEPLARIYLLPDEVYRTCANKDATWELANQLGISIPRQHVVANTQQALAAAAEFGYPLVLKPRASAEEKNPLHRHKVEKAENETDLLTLAAQMTASNPVQAQENFIGVGIGVEVLCNNGRILVAFEHERVHEPLKGGGSSYRRSVPLHPDMLAATSAIMQALDFTGVAMVEFKQNLSTGRWILIEINARFWGSLALSIAAGLDFPLFLVQLLLDGREDFPQKYRSGLYCRHWSRDLQWFLGNLRADKSNPTLQTRSFSSLARELGNILTLRERSDTFTFADPAPAWHDLKEFLYEKFFRVAKLLKPFRSFHNSRLRQLSQRSTHIIVLCYGNICRSPFGGVLLAERLGAQAISRGMHTKVGRRSPANAIAAAAEKGIDLETHRSALLTLPEFQAADMVLIFDRKNWLALRALAPELMGKVAYVGAADPAQPLEIRDPFDQDLDTFRLCYGRIESALTSLRAG